MSVALKVREHARKFFNPETFEGSSYRIMLSTSVTGMVLVELLVYFYLHQSAKVGELPYYIPDILIVGISILEVVVAPLFCYVGAAKRRTVMVRWIWLVLICSIPLFFLPKPETTADNGLCSVTVMFSNGIPTKAAVRLALLLLAAVSCGLGKSVVMGHGIAYLEEHAPSVNLFMHIGIMLLSRIMAYIMGNVVVGAATGIPWLQILLVLVNFPVALVGLYRYPEVAPRVDKVPRNDGGAHARNFSNRRAYPSSVNFKPTRRLSKICNA